MTAHAQPQANPQPATVRRTREPGQASLERNSMAALVFAAMAAMGLESRLERPAAPAEALVSAVAAPIAAALPALPVGSLPPPEVIAAADGLVAWEISAAPAPAAEPKGSSSPESLMSSDRWSPRPRKRMPPAFDTTAMRGLADWETVDWTRVDTHPALWWAEVCKIDTESRCGADALGRPMIDAPEGRSTLLAYDRSKPIAKRSVLLQEDKDGVRVLDSWPCMAWGREYTVYVATVLKRRPPTVPWRPAAAPAPPFLGRLGNWGALDSGQAEP